MPCPRALASWAGLAPETSCPSLNGVGFPAGFPLEGRRGSALAPEKCFPWTVDSTHRAWIIPLYPTVSGDSTL